MNIIIFILLLLSSIQSEQEYYRSTPDRKVDIHHSVIDIRLDLLAEKVIGKVSHTFSPLGSSVSNLDLDAEDMVVRRVRLGDKDIPFFQSEEKLHMDLVKAFSWSDTLTVVINYTATPRTGLYFFKPDSSYPNRRLQAWTQGEETDNHHWVPLYDYPNDRATFECKITVDKNLKAISNGELISKTDNQDGTHTFHWKENYAMVSYLISFVVGDYVKVEDKYNKVPINYWVYPENKNEAYRSFGKTPDMLEYFNEITGVNYPFEKYDQAIVSEFMWGGMENITLTHNTDRTMHDSKAQPDHSSDGLVAHELAHQWYGNMITTRNWSNIWLNEGFATFFSRLYLTKDKGEDEGDYIRLGEIRGYMKTDKAKRRPTVDFNYAEPFELFSSHVYAKGSLILNMLRDILGEDGFWKSVQHYTKQNKMKNVETMDLKKSIEETTGQNLDWFFRQWVYEPGYPEYEVSWTHNYRRKQLSVHVKQTQNLENTSIFKMPITLVIDNGEIIEKVIWVDEKDTVFDIPCINRPKMVVFNSGMKVPCKLKMEKSVADLKYQLVNSNNAIDRIWAAHELSKKKGRKIVEYIILDAAKSDNFWGVRKEACIAYGKLKPKINSSDLLWLKDESDNRVKRSFINILKHRIGDSGISEFLQNIIRSDTSYYAIADAFKVLSIVDSSSAKKYVDGLLNTESHNDIIRRSALFYFGQVRSRYNYNRLKELIEYGKFSWQSRPTIISELGKYQKYRPNTLDHLLSYLNDKDRFVRMAVINQIGLHGNKLHFDLLDSAVGMDPVLSINSRRAKEKIVARKNKKTKESNDYTIDQLNKKINEIKNIIEN